MQPSMLWLARSAMLATLISAIRACKALKASENDLVIVWVLDEPPAMSFAGLFGSIIENLGALGFL